MKKIILSIGFAVLLLSCRKETTVEQTTTVNSDGSTVTTTKTTTDYDLKLRKAEEAELEYRKADSAVIVAREKGDTKAERIAQEAADKAKEAWEATKRELKEAGAKTKEALDDAKKEIDSIVD